MIVPAGRHRQITDLFDDEQRCKAEESDALAQGAFAFGLGELGELGELGDEIGERDEVDKLAGAHLLDRERGGEMALAGPWRPEQMSDFGAGMKSSAASAMMRLGSSEGWNEKSKPARVLTTGNLGMRSAALIRRSSRIVNVALLDAARGGVEHLERAASSARRGCGGCCRPATGS